MSSFEQEYYEAASFWEGSALSDHSNMRRFEATVNLIPVDVHTLLDAGCGNGVFGRILEKTRPEITVLGVDRSITALTFVSGQTLQGSVNSLPVPDQSYDCVSCLQVIEHLPVEVFAQSITELARVAKTYLLIGVPFNEATDKNVTTCPQCKSTFNCDLHLRSFSDATMQSLFSKEGFRHVTSCYPGQHTKLVGADLFPLVKQFLSRSPTRKFLSPICPLCGYSEGDITALSVEKNAATVSPSRLRVLLRNTRLAVVKGISCFWPKAQFPGYWVVSLYQRQ